MLQRLQICFSLKASYNCISGLVSVGSTGSAEPFEFKWRVLEPVNFAGDILQLISLIGVANKFAPKNDQSRTDFVKYVLENPCHM